MGEIVCDVWTSRDTSFLDLLCCGWCEPTDISIKAISRHVRRNSTIPMSINRFGVCKKCPKTADKSVGAADGINGVAYGGSFKYAASEKQRNVCRCVCVSSKWYTVNKTNINKLHSTYVPLLCRRPYQVRMPLQRRLLIPYLRQRLSPIQHSYSLAPYKWCQFDWTDWSMASMALSMSYHFCEMPEYVYSKLNRHMKICARQHICRVCM